MRSESKFSILWLLYDSASCEFYFCYFCYYLLLLLLDHFVCLFCCSDWHQIRKISSVSCTITVICFSWTRIAIDWILSTDFFSECLYVIAIRNRKHIYCKRAPWKIKKQNVDVCGLNRIWFDFLKLQFNNNWDNFIDIFFQTDKQLQKYFLDDLCSEHVYQLCSGSFLTFSTSRMLIDVISGSLWYISQLFQKQRIWNNHRFFWRMKQNGNWNMFKMWLKKRKREHKCRGDIRHVHLPLPLPSFIMNKDGIIVTFLDLVNLCSPYCIITIMVNTTFTLLTYITQNTWKFKLNRKLKRKTVMKSNWIMKRAMLRCSYFDLIILQ